MLFLDHTQVQHCKLRGKDKPVSGIIYNNNIFVRAKAFPKEELEVAIKECREEYLDHEERSKIPTLLVKDKNSVGIWMQNGRYKQEDIIEISESDRSSATASFRGTIGCSTSAEMRRRPNAPACTRAVRRGRGADVRSSSESGTIAAWRRPSRTNPPR